MEYVVVVRVILDNVQNTFSIDLRGFKSNRSPRPISLFRIDFLSLLSIACHKLLVQLIVYLT